MEPQNALTILKVTLARQHTNVPTAKHLTSGLSPDPGTIVNLVLSTSLAPSISKNILETPPFIPLLLPSSPRTQKPFAHNATNNANPSLGSKPTSPPSSIAHSPPASAVSPLPPAANPSTLCLHFFTILRAVPARRNLPRRPSPNSSFLTTPLTALPSPMQLHQEPGSQNR